MKRSVIDIETDIATRSLCTSNGLPQPAFLPHSSSSVHAQLLLATPAVEYVHDSHTS